MRRVVLLFLLVMLLVPPVWGRNMEQFRLGVAEDVKTLDPMMASDTQSFAVALHIYEPLVNVDGRTKKLVPVLAEKWEVLDDHTYKFYLRKGVKFHNGDELKASDVVFSLKRFASDSIFAGSTGKYLDIDGFEIIDEHTVIVRTRGPIGGFLENMKLPAMTIMSERAVRELGSEYFRRPVGTGPFKFVSWTKGERIELKSWEEYWGKSPKFEKFSILVLPDDSSRVIALETGKVDMIYMVPASDFNRLNEGATTKVVKAPGLNLTYLGMNAQDSRLEDPRVRQAIEYGINKKVYGQVVFEGFSVVPSGPLVPSSTFTPKVTENWSFDREKAKSLLNDAGYPNGMDLTLWISNIRERIDGATVIQSMLAQIGIRVDIQVFESGVFYDRLKQGKQALFISRWGMQTNRDAGKYWNGLFNSQSIGGTNDTRTNDPKVDQLLAKGISTINDEARFKVYQELWDCLNQIHPLVPLAVANELYGGRKDLVGMEDFCDGRLNYLGNLTLE